MATTSTTTTNTTRRITIILPGGAVIICLPEQVQEIVKGAPSEVVNPWPQPFMPTTPWYPWPGTVIC